MEENDEAAGRGRRPGRESKRTEDEEREHLQQEKRAALGEDLLASRYRHGLDLWTGLPLKGQDARHRKRLAFGLQEDRDLPDKEEYDEDEDDEVA